jgi:diguanylate cyclase
LAIIKEKEKTGAHKVSQQVLDRLSLDDLLPTPENYELLYHYYMRTSPQIVKAIDALFDEGKSLTDSICGDLHYRLLSDFKNQEKVRRASEQVQSTIRDVATMVGDVQTSNADFQETLEMVGEKITDNLSPDEFKSLTKSAAEKTKLILHQNKTLEEKLLQSTQLMQDLQRDLEHVRKEALTDGLTGLANRKAFDAELEAQAIEARTTGQNFTLLMVDIDHFKSFNDNFGHQVGDQVLRLVARILKDSLKGRDIAARYGGEEFAIILPETDLTSAISVGNHLCKAIAMKDVINRSTGDVLGRITMSIGVAEFADEENLYDLIERADNALYNAKHNGRNQVAAAPTPKK